MIAGNYNTTEKELLVVKKLLQFYKIDYKLVKKHPVADDADVEVILKNGKSFLIEVKEESADRIQRYGDLGIDYISSCAFKKGVDANEWKGAPKAPGFLPKFQAQLDENNKNFKWGKIEYSKADVWLFFAEKNNKLIFADFYDGKKIKSNDFKKHLFKMCKFTLNNKPRWQKSHRDRHHSAVFFINRKDYMLEEIKVDLRNFIKTLED